MTFGRTNLQLNKKKSPEKYIYDNIGIQNKVENRITSRGSVTGVNRQGSNIYLNRGNTGTSFLEKKNKTQLKHNFKTSYSQNLSLRLGEDVRGYLTSFTKSREGLNFVDCSRHS